MDVEEKAKASTEKIKPKGKERKEQQNEQRMKARWVGGIEKQYKSKLRLGKRTSKDIRKRETK